MKEEQKFYILELLYDLEIQINEGEYYSYDRKDFEEHVENLEKLFGIKYDREELIKYWNSKGDYLT